MSKSTVEIICKELDEIKPTFQKYQFVALGNQHPTTRWEIAMPYEVDLFDLDYEDELDVDFATRKETVAFYKEYIEHEKQMVMKHTQLWLDINSTSLWLQNILEKHKVKS